MLLSDQVVCGGVNNAYGFGTRIISEELNRRIPLGPIYPPLSPLSI